MSTTYKRQRTASRYEEENVQTFIDSCVAFQSNVTFHTAADGAKLAQETQQAPAERGASQCVLLLGTAKDLSDAKKVADAFPHAAAVPDFAAIVAAAPEGSCYTAHIAANRMRILVGKTPDTASRHNCAVRPDVIHGIVKSAVAETPSEEKGGSLDIYVVGSGYELCIAAAVARASNRSFSAKGGRAEKSYLKPGIPVRVVMASAKDVEALRIAATSVQLSQRIVDAPTNLLDTVTYTEIACRILDELRAKQNIDVSAHVVQGEELREAGYGGLYGTGKAAEFPPHLVTLSYKPKGGIDPADKIAFVGKGIVYDTGGLAIKSRDGMCGMKHDMGGSAGVFGAFLALAKLQVPAAVSCVLCLADNAVGPRSQRNDDIIRMKSGVTVEINNTDAEGRLVLSDGVYHASAELPYTPSIIVDMATLTGAQGIATGKYHAAIYANTDASESRFVAAGRRCGDLCHPVVYCPELHNGEYKSAVADYRNSVANRANAQVSCAAQFIGNNLAKEYKGEWVHVDMAYPANYDQATGYGVALLLQAFAGDRF